MPEFRKKPVIINAEQYSYASLPWPEGVLKYSEVFEGDPLSICDQCSQPLYVHGAIKTLEAPHRVCPGDWIITGVQGERYACKPEIFEQTYEPVQESRVLAPK